LLNFHFFAFTSVCSAQTRTTTFRCIFLASEQVHLYIKDAKETIVLHRVRLSAHLDAILLVEQL